MSDFAEAIVNPVLQELRDAYFSGYTKRPHLFATPEELTYKFSDYKSDAFFKPKFETVPSNGIKNFVSNAETEAERQDEKVAMMLAARDMEEQKRVSLLANKKYPMKLSPPKKVQPFSEKQLEILTKKCEIEREKSKQRIWNAETRRFERRFEPANSVHWCSESANALVIINSLEKRYGTPENMRHELWKPGGPMCLKSWEALQKDMNDMNEMNEMNIE